MKALEACPVCGMEMLPRSLWRHCRRAHGKALNELTTTHTPAGIPAPRLPVEPILRHLHLMGGTGVGASLAIAGVHMGTAARARLDKALERAIDDGELTVAAADAICCHVLRLHPCLVYGDAWWTSTAKDREGAA